MYRLIPLFLFLFLIPISVTNAASLDIGIRDISEIRKNSKQTFELVQQAGEQIGYKINYVYYPSKRTIKLADLGVLDGEMLRHSSIESFYPALVRVDEAIAWFDYWVWVPQEKECMPDRDSLALLKPVGIQGVEFYNTRIYPFSQVGYEEAKDVDQMINILARGRADYTVHAKRVINNASKGNKLKTCLDAPIFSMPFFLYLHESNSYLVTDFEQAIRTLKAEKKFIIEHE